MPGAITGAWGRLRRTVAEFTLPQKTLAILAVAGLVLGITLLVSWATRTTMSPVFSGMSAQDAAAVVETLQSQGVAYELTDGGSTVLVPADQVYDLRIALASEGLPTEEGGYSLLDDMGMTTSDFQQQVTYQRALEGELASTISAMDGVAAATVHLALPEESVFTDTAQEPTASVFVQLETGQTLGSGAVQAIVNLVSSAVSGMEPLGVTVVDAEGNVLSSDGAGGGADGATDYEQRVAGQVQAMLDRVLGTGNSVVSVTAELNRDATERLSETFASADGAPPLSSSSTTEQYTGGGQAVGGVLGPDNIAVPQGGGEGEYLREEETTNNPVNKVTEQTTVNPGGVARQSVSVVVDTQAAAGIPLNELDRIVSAAAGIDPARGDQVAVAQMAFDTSTADAAQEALEAQAAAEAAERQAALLRTAIIAGVGVVLLTMLALWLRRRRQQREEVDLGELELTTPPELLPPEPESTSVLTPAPELGAIERDATDQARAEVAALADEDPAAVADRLRQWLAVRQ